MLNNTGLYFEVKLLCLCSSPFNVDCGHASLKSFFNRCHGNAVLNAYGSPEGLMFKLLSLRSVFWLFSFGRTVCDEYYYDIKCILIDRRIPYK